MRVVLVLFAVAIGIGACTSGGEPPKSEPSQRDATAKAPGKVEPRPTDDGGKVDTPPTTFSPETDPLAETTETPPVTSTALEVDMSKFDLSCKRDRECTLVSEAPCRTCGCSYAPLAVRDEKAFVAQRRAIVCPAAEPLPPGAGCGGCRGRTAKCEGGKCVASVE